MTKTITIGNFKGGVGKTTNACMISYLLALKGYKVLLVDLDPQGNATSLMLKTKQRQDPENVVMFDKTLMTAIYEEDISTIITPITKTLDLLPSYVDFTSYYNFLEKEYPGTNSQYSRAIHFDKLLKDIKPGYDFVLIDVPPTVSIYTDSALMSSDYTMIVLQTHERSMEGASKYIIYLNELIQNFNANFDVLGILPVLIKNNSTVDKAILYSAHEEFGDNNMFNNVIKNMERLKRYDMYGIGDYTVDPNTDYHDRRVFDVYDDVTDEFLKRLEEKEQEKL